MPGEHSRSSEFKRCLQKRKSKRLTTRVRLIRRRVANSRVRVFSIIALTFVLLSPALAHAQSVSFALTSVSPSLKIGRRNQGNLGGERHSNADRRTKCVEGGAQIL